MIEGRGRYSRPLEWTLDPVSGPAPLVLLLHGLRQDRRFSLEAWGPLAGRVHRLAAAGPCVHEWGRPRRIGNAWYVYDGDREALQGEMALTSAALDTLIDDVAGRVEISDLWVAGFSQGAYLALYYGLAHNRAVTRVQAIAGNVNVHATFESLAGKTVHLEHGREDAACPVERMEQLEQLLSQRGAAVTRRLHACGHEVIPGMMDSLLAPLDD